jgi:hypothetical protein
MDFEARAQALLEVKKEEMGAYRASIGGQKTLVAALSLYLYFEQRDAPGTAPYHEIEFHMKALLDDTLNRLFADLAAPPIEGESKKATPAAAAASGGSDPWADF